MLPLPEGGGRKKRPSPQPYNVARHVTPPTVVTDDASVIGADRAHRQRGNNVGSSGRTDLVRVSSLNTPHPVSPGALASSKDGDATQIKQYGGKKPRAAETDKLIGQRLGRYRIIKKIGQGGMAAVYLAENVFIGRELALKLLPTSWSEDDRFVKRFMREAQLASNLEHPNIVPVWDVGREEGHYFIAMPFVDGCSMKDDLIRRGAPYSARRSTHWFAQVLDGLQHAHEHGVIHRDLKPDNFLLSDDKVLKIADFGIARPADDSMTMLTRPGQRIGTPQFMAPELFLNESASEGEQTDLYSLGVCMFFAASGHFPYQMSNKMSEAYQALANREPAALQPLRPDLSSQFCDFVETILSRDPDRRPKSAAEARHWIASL